MPEDSRTACNTLCWFCRNTYASACPWMTPPHRPVPGWTAVRRDLRGVNSSDPPVESYAVVHCPRFRPDPRFAQDCRRFRPGKALQEKTRLRALLRRDVPTDTSASPEQ